MSPVSLNTEVPVVDNPNRYAHTSVIDLPITPDMKFSLEDRHDNATEPFVSALLGLFNTKLDEGYLPNELTRVVIARGFAVALGHAHQENNSNAVVFNKKDPVQPPYLELYNLDQDKYVTIAPVLEPEKSSANVEKSYSRVRKASVLPFMPAFASLVYSGAGAVTNILGNIDKRVYQQRILTLETEVKDGERISWLQTTLVRKLEDIKSS